jgi:predicted nuclease of restriction endonuclease-like (RecB) superfamily
MNFKIYHELLVSLKEKILRSRSVAVLTANRQILVMYWDIGKTIEEMENSAGWGAKTIEHLARDLKIEFPEMKGLSARNLRYMREFSKAYPNYQEMQNIVNQSIGNIAPKASHEISQFLQQPAAKSKPALLNYIYQLPWAHHLLLLDKLKLPADRLFYIRKTVENGWSRNILAVQIESKLHERQGKALNNFDETLPQDRSDLAIETFKNPYLLDFLDIGEKIKERDLEKALITHIRTFLLELGKGFAYVGNQHNIKVENDDYYLDLLFFNINLNCFVVFELKVGEFSPEFAGKLNFYINTIDNQIKSKRHNRTIGVLLCKTPNNTVVRYALEGTKQPMAVSDYKLSKALPKQLKGEIPTIAELEKELEGKAKELLRPAEKRFELLKNKFDALNRDKVEKTIRQASLMDLFRTSVRPLCEHLIDRIRPFSRYYLEITNTWHINNTAFPSLFELEHHLNKLQSQPINRISHLIWLKTFILGGVDAFNSALQLNLILDEHYYGFSLTNYENQKIIKKKLYSQNLLPDEINELCDLVCNQLMDQIEVFELT